TYVAVASRATYGAHRPALPGRRARRAAVAAGATYVLALSGALVVETGSSAGCSGWPLCSGGLQLPSTEADVVNVAHRFVAALVVVAVVVLMFALLRDRSETSPVRRWAAAVIVIATLQMLAGALVVELRLPPAAQAVHVALASALWASVLVVAVMKRPISVP